MLDFQEEKRGKGLRGPSWELLSTDFWGSCGTKNLLPDEMVCIDVGSSNLYDRGVYPNRNLRAYPVKTF
jgi:hypothetical protein